MVETTPAALWSKGRLAQLSAAAPVVAPSLLQCDFGHLAEVVRQLELAGVQAFHLDVMDGQFVPNFSYGLTIVEAVRRVTTLPLDVHLMIAEPEKWVERFRDAGADSMTVHVEATSNAPALLQKIRALGAQCGIALNPPTPLAAIEPSLAECDLVLVMSVMPGFGGQSFDSVAIEKLQALRAWPRRQFLLEVDGGLHAGTIERSVAAGADLLVVGSAIFGQEDISRQFRSLAALAQRPSSGAIS